jgi:hypothetical protein
VYVDAVDSHYQYVKARIKTMNSNRLVMGMLNSQDWPPQGVKMESFYLLVLTDSPGSPEGSSLAAPLYAHNVQWVWLIAGTGTRQNEKASYRGARFRTNQAMKGELIYGLLPPMCEKQTWSLQGNLWVGTSHDPVEFVFWNRPRIQDRESGGLVYGLAPVSIMDFTDNTTT